MQLNRQQQGTVEYIKPEKIKDDVIIKEKKIIRQKIFEWLVNQKKIGKKPKFVDIIYKFGNTGNTNYSIRILITEKKITKKYFECKVCKYYDVLEPKKTKNVQK